MTAPERPLRILVVHSSLLYRTFEASEVWQIVTALLRTAPSGQVMVSVTDCRQAWEAVLVDGRADLGAAQPLRAAWRDGFDVVHVHLPIPLRQLLWAALFRLRRVPVIFSPMALLCDDFGQASWFRGRHPTFRHVKPTLVRLLAMVWTSLSTWVMCLSAEEQRQTRVPAAKTLFAPWPLPDTPLAQAAASAATWPPVDGRDTAGPLAFVSRLDPWRKGIDRLCAWTAAYTQSLPRPAVLLLSPAGEDTPPELDAAVREGVVEWDTQTRGAALLPRLRSCRGAILLSRWEAQPRALREAVVLGLPTISTPSAHFSEVVDVLGFGAVVDGDDPDEVQAAFEAIRLQSPNRGAAKALFGMAEQAQWLLGVYASVAQGEAPPEPDYYKVAARIAPMLAKEG